MSSCRVAVLQSSYIPWKGYFDIAHDVDLFVFLDDVQFTRRDWRSRNKVKTPQGAGWLTIPVTAERSTRICDVAIPEPHWQEKHWKTLVGNYGRCPHFSTYRDFFEDVYRGRVWKRLAELNQYLIGYIASEFLGIKTQFADSRAYMVEGQKLDRLTSLVVQTGATSYLSGPSARAYIPAGHFESLGIQLVWKDYRGYPEYPQRFPPFAHDVSILDLLFNVGGEAPWYIWGWRGLDGGAT